MKLRFVSTLVVVLVFALSIACSQSKDCNAMSSSAKASCCTHGAKASLSSNGKNSIRNQVSIITVNDKAQCVKGSKECTMKEAKNGKECPEMTTASGKMDCCKGKTKASQAKNSTKKSTQEKAAEAKGTN
jgi:hypothetical protein